MDWLEEAAGRGAGELLLTSWDQDGTQRLRPEPSERRLGARVPIIASGGASTPAHMTQAFQAGAHAVLAASIFHDDEMTCAQVKTALRQQGMEVRI